MKVKINTTNIKSQVKNIYEYIDEYDFLIKEFAVKIEEMSYNWIGSDFDNFKEKIYTFISELLKTKKSITSYNDLLNNYITEISSLNDKYDKEIDLT